MKVLLLLMLAVAMAAGVEDPVEQVVQICDTNMLTALQRICEHKDLEFLLQNNEYDPSHHQHEHKHHHHRDGNHSHAAKKDSTLSIAEECCHKPCLVKDFMSYCGDM